MSLKRAIQNWNMKYVDVVRSPGSVMRVFTSSERLANQLKKNEMDDPKVEKIGEVGNLVKKIEMGAPRTGKLVKKNEMHGPKVEPVGVVAKLVERVELGGPQARKLMKKVETGDRKVGELVKRIQIRRHHWKGAALAGCDGGTRQGDEVSA